MPIVVGRPKIILFSVICATITTVPSIVTWKSIEYNIKNIELEGIASTMMVLISQLTFQRIYL
ncbi:MAG: hypothetical protein ACRD8K_00285 [Nitrososphaeraceae archaeon]